MVCPHCDVYSHLTQRWTEKSRSDAPWGNESPVGCCTCDRCGLPIAVVYTNTLASEIERYWPIRASGQSFPDVPEPLAAAASEAHVCLDALSPRGAVAIARSVVEAIAKDKGITKGSLKAKIDALRSADLINEAMKETAEEIRLAGNEAAHGDLVSEQLTIDDADEIVGLMDLMLERIYREPAELARIRTKRERRSQAQQPSVEATESDPDA